MKMSMKDLKSWMTDHPYPRTLATIGGASICSMLALELPSNHGLWKMQPGPALLELLLIFCFLCLLFYLPHRRKTPAIVGIAALASIGIAEYFVITFKSMPIQPGDLFALSTAATVAGSYTYELSTFCFMGLAAAALGIALIVLIPRDACGRPPRRASETSPDPIDHAMSASLKSKDPKASPATEGTSTAPREHPVATKSKLPLSVHRRTALVAGAVLGAQAFISYYDTLGIKLHTWKPLESYYSQGFLPTFISSAQKMVPPKPKHYKSGEASAIIKRLAARWNAGTNGIADPSRVAAVEQFDQLKPSVICIMNESFADLSIFNELGCGYKGPERFKAIDTALLQGVSYMSAFGAGTCNSEFEFLTGHSMAFLGAGVYPFMTYNLAPSENLARQFKRLGYRTVAMHPNHATNWNRENVYKDFGFDQFLSINDFQGADTLRGMVTDQATYDKILELLDQNADPQFIFDVTMQNHSGYDTGLLPADKQMHLNIDTTDLDAKTVEDGTLSDVDEYVSCIEQSDQALRYFLNALSRLDRKVVVVFWGDHQPFFPSKFNDKWFTDEDDATHQERLWQTDYIIWANYDVAGCDQTSEVDDLSTNYLSTQLMQLIGAPLSDYQKAHMTLRESLPAINSVGYEDASLRWALSSNVTGDDAAAAAATKAREDYAKMQYYEMFRDGKNVYTEHFQTEANETDPNLAPGTTKIK